MNSSKKSVRILFYTHFFSPEVGAGSLRAQYFVKALRDAGYYVKVVAPTPNYPHGKIYPGYKKNYYVDKDNNVVYLPIFIPKSHSLISRGILYSSYLITSFFYCTFSSFKPNLIISSSPPILTSLSAYLVSKLKRTKFVLDLRDIWPDIGIELGMLQNKIIISLLAKIEELLLQKAAKITVTAKGDKLNIVSKGVDKEKVKVIYNGADTELFYPKGTSEITELKKYFNLPLDKKLLIYFGSFNYGMNDIESMESSILNLPNEKDEFHFIAVGGGDLKTDFLENISKNLSYSSFKNLSNKEMADLISVCDISLIPRKNIVRDTGGNIPVKCFESWAAGVPVLLSADHNTEIAKIFKECGGGVLVPPSNPTLFRDGLISLIKKPNLKELGKIGRNFVMDRFERQYLSKKIINIVDELTVEEH